MVRIYFLTIISLLLFSCHSSAQTAKTDSKDPEVLVGKQKRKKLTKTPYGAWFNQNYKDYKIDPEIKPMLEPLLKDVSIKIFMGTWCSDSQREVPTFYKILDAANYEYRNLELITVSREKDTPTGLEKGLDIQRVPTFIFYKGGKELGRYVEFAVTTLENDILSVLSGTDYQHSYYTDQ